jgi:hypothetical protein
MHSGSVGAVVAATDSVGCMGRASVFIIVER